MSEAEKWTIGRLLSWTAEYLKQQGADTPRLDAEVLLAHARGCKRIELYTAFGDEASPETRATFKTLVGRRAKGEPVAYLVGHREFYSLPFAVSREVLIPRPETEHLVIALLDRAKELLAGEERPLAIADVGTGSGIIAICAAKYLPTAQIAAIDIRPQSLAVAKQNAEAHEVADRVKLIEGDLLSKLPAKPTLDFVVSNPPYIKTAEMAELRSDVRDYEPHAALEAGPNGTEVIERLIPQAADRLKPGGWLLLEISPMIEPAVLALIAADGRFETASTVKDLARLARVIQARKHG